MTHRRLPEGIAVMFDIDGTLLDLRGAGRRAFQSALQKVFGWRDDMAYVDFAGNTDLNVLAQVAAAHGHRLTARDRQAFFKALPRELRRAVRRRGVFLQPGIRRLLRVLSKDPRVTLALVTGNIEQCAKIKLRVFGIHGHFLLGAFGDEHADRSAIARRALRRVREALRAKRRLRAVYLVGDTPYDIAAAKAIGACAVAVATGRYTVAQLHRAGADFVFRDLSDTRAVLRALGLSANEGKSREKGRFGSAAHPR